MPRSVRVTGDRQTNKCKAYWQQHQWKPPSSPLFGQFHKDWTNRYSQNTGCATVVTMTSKVNGKTGTLTPCRSETPENFITKIGHIDYVAGGNTHAKFYGNRPRGVRLTNSQNITSCDFVYLPFPFYPRDAMLARVIAIATCESVRLSVCHAPVLCQNEES